MSKHLPVFALFYPAHGSMVIKVLTLIIFFISTLNCNADQQPGVCSEIHKQIILRQQNRAPADFIVEYQEQGVGADIYPNLDIDGDGAADSILRSCGAGLDALCYLFVKLSNKKELELEEVQYWVQARLFFLSCLTRMALT